MPLCLLLTWGATMGTFTLYHCSSYFFLLLCTIVSLVHSSRDGRSPAERHATRVV